jgi:hypothetical protein
LCAGIVHVLVGDGSSDPISYGADAFDISLFETWWRDEIVTENEKQACLQSAKAWSKTAVLAFGTQVAAVNINRRFFISVNGFMCLAPAEAEEGDLICVLFGGKVPFVVRQDPEIVSNHKGTEWPDYKLLGDSYVRGIMAGELARAWQDEEKRCGDICLI